VLFWTALFMLSVALQYGAAMVPQKALALTGAVFTSNFDGTGIDLNIYDSKDAVYLTGGPCQGGSHLADGDYYFEITSPNGVLLSNDSIGDRFITVDGGFIVSTSSHVTHDVACTSDPGITVKLMPYDDTPNPGGEYKLTVATASSVEECNGFDADSTDPIFEICNQADQKSDNYKVGPNGDLRIVKEVDGGEVSGDFDFHVDCGDAGEFDVTVTFPDPGFVVIPDLPEDAQGTVTETGMPSPPANFEWGPVTISGSPATIVGDATVTVTATNHLIRQTGDLTIIKEVTGGPEGFEGSFDVHVDCGADGVFDRTIDFPDPGEVTIDDIPAGAECTVTETGVPADPDGFEWGDPDISGSPATIEANATVTVSITNPLEELPPPDVPTLTIDKSNDSPGVSGVAEGDTVHFTLDYDLTNGPVDKGVIEDVLPDGLTYVEDSATDSDEFVFISYTSATRTLRWEALQVTKDGTVEYDATVDDGAAGNAQPLINTATIDSEDTGPDSDTSQVFVAPPPEAETAPPTDVAGSSEPASPAGSLLLVLLALAGIVLAVVFVAPTPASIRRRFDR